jgi:hypothetical protein
MSVVQKVLLFAAGLFLAIAFITIGVNLFGTGQEAAKQAQNDFSSMQTELSEKNYEGFDNATLTGSQVINAIRKYQNKEMFGIQVTTGKNTKDNIEGLWYGDIISTVGNPGTPGYGSYLGDGTGSLDLATDEKLPYYINPSGQFKGKIIRDNNNVTRGITFVQL